MAFNPQTGLVYIPTQVLSTQYAADPHFKPHPIGWNLATGTEFGDAVKGYLLAWIQWDRKRCGARIISGRGMAEC